MTTTVQNIKTVAIPIVRGNAVPFNLIIKNAGVALDLTNGTLWFTVKKHWNSTSEDNKVLEKSNSTHDDSVNGLTSIKLSSAETLLFEVGKDYYYDFTFIDSAGDPLTYLRGKLDILYNVKDY